MKTKIIRLVAAAIVLLALSTLNSQLSTTFAQGTAFTYQGRLNDGAGPATGLYDFRFAVYDDANAGGIQSTPVLVTLGVTNGLFTTTLNFGGNVFNGSARWLEINVRTNGAVDYATLAPRQPVTPAPYAIYAAAAGGVNAAAIIGTLAPAQLPDGTLTNNAGGVTLSGSFIGSGGSLTGVNAATLNGLGSGGFWQLGGNNVSNGQFLGSTNNQPVEIWAGGQRALRLEPTANDNLHSNIVNVVGGSSGNFIAPGVYGSVIAGGGALNYYGPGTNSVSADVSFLGGGYGNSIQPYAEESFLGGGWNNSIQPNAHHSFLGGGEDNSIQAGSEESFLGGGYDNSIQPNAWSSVLVGGYANSIQTNAAYSFLGGGFDNSIQPNAFNSVLGGGWNNSIQTNAGESFLGGGYENSIQTNAGASVLGGGGKNSIQPNALNSFLGGGENNSIQPNADHSFLGGGAGNSIQTNAASSALGGGWDNQVLANAPYSSLGGGAHNRVGGAGGTVPGGNGNGANGVNSFAAGTQAKANHDGSFVLADLQYVDFASTAPNQLSARFTGGVRFVTSGAGLTVDGAPVLTSGNGSGLTIQTNADGAPNIIGGSSVNYIASGVEGSTIAGGGATGFTNSISAGANYSFLGGGEENSIQTGAYASFLGGGAGNSIQTDAWNSVLVGGDNNSIQPDHSFLGGGGGNSIQPYASESFLGGGYGNSIQPNANRSFLGGGWVNSIQTNAWSSVLVGGANNSIQPYADHSFLGGGLDNFIQTNAAYSFLGGGQYNTNGAPNSIVPGGDRNFAGGTNSFAAGHRAKANYAGDFVWADSQDTDFNSTATNQFSVRAAGGVQFVTSGAGLTVDGAPVLTSGNGSGLTVQTNADGAPNIIAGSSVNYIASGVEGSVIAGGGATNYLGLYGPYTNSVSANYSFLGGGSGNSIQPNADHSFLGGGYVNSIQTDAGDSFLGGGANNSIQTDSFMSFLGGGSGNSIQPNADHSFLGGGYVNSIQTDANCSFLGGGYVNSIQPYACYSFLGGGCANSIQPNARSSFLGGGSANSIQTNAYDSFLGGGEYNTNGAPLSIVPGGDQNFAGGTNSFAAGHRAKANYAGDFVWADSQDADFNSTANNQFLIRAANGVGINKANPASALDVNGTVTATSFVGGGSGLTSLNAASLGTSSINNNQLVNNSVTVSAGTGLSGGGAVALGGSVTLNNVGVLSVGAGSPLASSGGQNPQITLTGIVSIANGGLGFAPGVLSAGQYIRSSGSGAWSVNSIQAGDLPSLSSTYVDLSSGQTIGGTKNFSGSVGIGISPGYPLDVNGRMALRGSSSGVNAGLWLYDSAATSHTTRALLGMDGTGYFGLWGDLGANWGMVMNVTNGYVGIGTGTPDALLTVNGTADKPGGGSWSTFSDGRLKDVGAKFTHGLADLERIQPVHYHYKADNPLNLPSQPEYVGVVAQQVQPAIPEAVQPNKDGYLTVNNDPIIWTMVNAIKELNQKVEDKNAENAELKAQNQALAARLERIEKLLGQKLK